MSWPLRNELRILNDITSFERVVGTRSTFHLGRWWSDSIECWRRDQATKYKVSTSFFMGSWGTSLDLLGLLLFSWRVRRTFPLKHHSLHTTSHTILRICLDSSEYPRPVVNYWSSWSWQVLQAVVADVELLEPTAARLAREDFRTMNFHGLVMNLSSSTAEVMPVKKSGELLAASAFLVWSCSSQPHLIYAIQVPLTDHEDKHLHKNTDSVPHSAVTLKRECHYLCVTIILATYWVVQKSGLEDSKRKWVVSRIGSREETPAHFRKQQAKERQLPSTVAHCAEEIAKIIRRISKTLNKIRN